MKKELLAQPLGLGEVYASGNRLYLILSIDDDCLMPSVRLRRLKDGYEFDAAGAALYRTERGTELLWDTSKNGCFAH